jgi:hypothetical protein
MSQLPGGAASAPPNIIYIIRHGEKPADPPAVAAGQTPPPPPPGPPFGVDFQGNQNPHSLLPRGWQRSGALAVLFDPAAGPLPAGLQTPGALLSPSYGNPDKTAGHRTYQTIQGLSDRLGLAIVSGYAEGDEPQLTSYVVSAYSGVVLICWEHHHIPALASSLPAVAGTSIPQTWPDDRFDVIWAFTLVSAAPAPAAPAPAAPAPAVQYAFAQIPQQLLSGDADTIIPVLPRGPLREASGPSRSRAPRLPASSACRPDTEAGLPASISASACFARRPVRCAACQANRNSRRPKRRRQTD